IWLSAYARVPSHRRDATDRGTAPHHGSVACGRVKLAARETPGGCDPFPGRWPHRPPGAVFSSLRPTTDLRRPGLADALAGTPTDYQGADPAGPQRSTAVIHSQRVPCGAAPDTGRLGACLC